MNIVLPERRRSANRYLERVKVMPGDIAEQAVDAIVTVLPQSLEYRGLVNSRIAEEAGPELRQFIEDHIFEPRAGEVYVSPGYNLQCQHIIFAIVPAWRTEFDRQDRDLLNATRRAMEEAYNMGLKTVAFPPMASGRRGFPKKRASRLIIQGIEERFGPQHEENAFEEVRIVARTEETCRVFRKLLDVV